jgi:hypothetical protein
MVRHATHAIYIILFKQYRLGQRINAYAALVLMAIKLFAGFRHTSRWEPKFPVVAIKLDD